MTQLTLNAGTCGDCGIAFHKCQCEPEPANYGQPFDPSALEPYSIDDVREEVEAELMVNRRQHDPNEKSWQRRKRETEEYVDAVINERFGVSNAHQFE